MDCWVTIKRRFRILTKAIELRNERWLADAYFYRAATLEPIGEYDLAIDDMKTAATVGFQPAQEFLKAKRLMGSFWLA